MKKSKLIGLITAALLFASALVIPGYGELSHAAVAGICVLIATLVLLLTDALPIAVTTLLAPAMLIFLSVVDKPADAFSGFTNPILFFILASFAISHAITSTSLSKRMLVGMMSIFGKDINTLILAIMLCTALISSIMSNVAACIIFMTVALDFLNIYDKEEDRRRTGKTIMIALPVSGMIGGMITPAGSSLNLMVLSQLEENTGSTVSFVRWMFLAIPLVIVILPLSWFIITRVNKPAGLTAEKLDGYIKQIIINEELSFKEKYLTIILVTMFVLWVLSSWFPILNITAVSIVGLVLLFFPGLEAFTWEDLEKNISWSAILLVGVFITLGNILGSTGAIAWISGILVPDSMTLPPFLITFVLAAIVFAMLVIIPSAPALIPILSGPFLALANMAGVSPVLPMMTLAFVVCNCFLLPFDAVPVITYMTGFYRKDELAKTAICIQLAIAVLVALWLPVGLNILGM